MVWCLCITKYLTLQLFAKLINFEITWTAGRVKRGYLLYEVRDYIYNIGGVITASLPLQRQSYHYRGIKTLTEAKFLDKMQTKIWGVLLLVLHSHLYSFSLGYLLLQTHATSYSFCKGERRKTRKKTIPPSLWFKKSIQKPQLWELSRLCPETLMKFKLYVYEFGLWLHYKDMIIERLPMSDPYPAFFLPIATTSNKKF
jgi:hypothetical protein